MAHPSNAVFISYRRDVSGYLALALYQHLADLGVDAFYDFENIHAGRFDTIILEQVALRPYFALLLTPGTLDRCGDPADWLRREVAEALRADRVIVLVYTPEFDWEDFDRFLPPEVAGEVKRFNGQELNQRWFKYAVQRLVEDFLVPVGPVAPQPKTMPERLPPRPDVPVSYLVELQEAIDSAEEMSRMQQLDILDRLMAKARGDDLADVERLLKRFGRRQDLVVSVAGLINDFLQRHEVTVSATPIANSAPSVAEGLATDDVDAPAKEQAEAKRDAAAQAKRDAAAQAKRDAAAQAKRDAEGRANRGDWKGAVADLTEAIRLDPDASLYDSRGMARSRDGDQEGAVADFTEAIRLAGDFASRYSRRGMARYRRCDWKGAVADLTEAIRLDPDIATFYLMRGSARSEDGDQEGAVADLTEAIRLDPNDASCYKYRGLARFRGGDRTGAVADLTEAIRLDPNDASCYKYRGLARAGDGDRTAAIADYTEAIRLDPSDVDLVAALKSARQR